MIAELGGLGAEGREKVTVLEERVGKRMLVMGEKVGQGRRRGRDCSTLRRMDPEAGRRLEDQKKNWKKKPRRTTQIPEKKRVGMDSLSRQRKGKTGGIFLRETEKVGNHCEEGLDVRFSSKEDIDPGELGR